MNFIIFYILILILLFLLIIGIIYLGYLVPKKLGYRKTGIMISRILSVVFTIFILTIIFEDKLFFKSDVRDYLSQQNIILNDNFSIIKNESGGFTDYYHRFELEISNSDQKRLINQIKKGSNFQKEKNIETYLPSLLKNIHKNDTLFANYETELEYKKAILYTNGEGYSPTYRIISISKNKNRLIFEEILE